MGACLERMLRHAAGAVPPDDDESVAAHRAPSSRMGGAASASPKRRRVEHLADGTGAGSGGAVASRSPWEETSPDRAALKRGIVRFNTHGAKSGIAWLVAHGLLPEGDPGAVASFLFHDGALVSPAELEQQRQAPHLWVRVQEPLAKQQIGEYLGARGRDAPERAFHADVLRAYMRHFNFAGATLVAALRELLVAFRLPGEAQQIDRLVSAFATAYCEQQAAQRAGGAPPGAVPEAQAFALDADIHAATAAEVQGVEYLGNCQIVTLKTAQDSVVRAKIDVHTVARRGDQTGLAFDSTQITLFDQSSGRAIRTARDALPLAGAARTGAAHG